MRHDRTFSELLALFHIVAFEHDDVLRERDQMFFLGSGLGIFQDEATFSANSSAHLGHNAVDLGNLGRVLWPTSFE